MAEFHKYSVEEKKPDTNVSQGNYVDVMAYLCLLIKYVRLRNK